jgi:hypothetical protein
MRRFPLWLVLTTCTSAGALAVIACTQETTKPSGLDVEDDDSGTKKRDTGASSSGTSSGASSGTSSGDLDGSSANGRIYAHTPTKLYLFEPVTKNLTPVGDFDCLGTDKMVDIALDRGGMMFGTAFHKFVSIDPTNAKCTVIKDIGAAYYPNSLSFVPVGTIDPTKEVLVGYVQSDNNGDIYVDTYVRIDTTNGDLQIIGQEGDLNPPGGLGGKYYDVAGDVIALINDNNKAYVIVADDPYTDAGAASTTNHLAEINPKTGTLTKIIGPTNQLNTFGFAYWAGKGYGFSEDGRVTEINMATGAATTVLQLDGGTAWYGAGVTTDSPAQ